MSAHIAGRRIFRQLPGAAGASFDLSQGLADLAFKPGAAVSDRCIREAVRNASHTPGPIRRQNGSTQAGPQADNPSPIPPSMTFSGHGR